MTFQNHISPQNIVYFCGKIMKTLKHCKCNIKDCRFVKSQRFQFKVKNENNCELMSFVISLWNH